MPRGRRTPAEGAAEGWVDEGMALHAAGVKIDQGEPTDEELAKFLGAGRKKRKRSPTKASWESAMHEVEGMNAANDWGAAGGRHMLALYALLHLRTYKAAASDLDSPAERVRAIGAANRMLDKQFNGDAGECASFVQWVWRRERDRHDWRQKNNRPLTRMRWQACLSLGFLTDWKVAISGTR